MLYVIVGAGQLGSLLVTELIRRRRAEDKTSSTTIVQFDDDIVEDRNVASQFFSPLHIGRTKVDVMKKIADEYGVKYTPMEERFDNERKFQDVMDMYEHTELNKILLIDCTDNATSRYFIWNTAMVYGVSLLCMGTSQLDGFVGFTIPSTKYDMNPFSLTCGGERLITWLEEEEKEALGKKNKPNKLPPCELALLRSLGFNTASAALEAIEIYKGCNRGGYLPGGEYCDFGTTTHWRTTKDVKELVYINGEPV